MKPDDTSDAFQRFLERATEDPVPSVIELRPDRKDQQEDHAIKGRSKHRLLFVAAALVLVAGGFAAFRSLLETELVESSPAASVEGAAGETTPTEVVPDSALRVEDDDQATPSSTATPSESSSSGTSSATEPPTGPTALLRVTFDQSLAGAENGTAVVPTFGPELRVDRVGETGAIEAVEGGGLSFLPGGQQRRSYAIIGIVGSDVAGLVPDAGRIAVAFTPQVNMADRTVPSGRNIHTFFEIVSEEGPDSLVASAALHVDVASGPYLSGNIQGLDFNHPLSESEMAEFSAGSLVELSIDWTPDQGRLLLNGRTLTQIDLEPGSTDWTSSARLSVGGSATYGGGYFTIKDDAIRSFEIAEAE